MKVREYIGVVSYTVANKTRYIDRFTGKVIDKPSGKRRDYNEFLDRNIYIIFPSKDEDYTLDAYLY